MQTSSGKVAVVLFLVAVALAFVVLLNVQAPADTRQRMDVEIVNALASGVIVGAAGLWIRRLLEYGTARREAERAQRNGEQERVDGARVRRCYVVKLEPTISARDRRRPDDWETVRHAGGRPDRQPDSHIPAIGSARGPRCGSEANLVIT